MITKEQAKILLKSGTSEDLYMLDLLLNDPYYSFIPREDKPEEFDEQESFIKDSFAGISCVIAGNACFAPDTRIRMFDGSVALAKNITIGDQLMGPDGKPRTVLDLHSGVDQMYEIKARNKCEKYSSYTVNSNHILSLKNNKKTINISVSDFLINPNENYKGYKIIKNNIFTYSINIIPKGLGEYYGWECDGDHLFLLEDYTVVHNSGKSFSAAYKVAKFLRTTEPPTDLCKFFIASQTSNMVGMLFQEKLSKFIPNEMIESVTWFNSKENHPKSVILMPSSNGNRWQILFRSYEMGRKSFQAVSECAGWWCDEQVPSLSLLNEIDTRTREFNFTGNKIYSLTPLEPDQELEDRFNDPSSYPYWKFYRMNAEKNFEAGGISNLDWLANTSEDMRETRRIGDFANFEGAIFKEFNPIFHVGLMPNRFPEFAKFYRTVDFGYNHPTSCLLTASYGDMIWVIKEYRESNQLIADKVAAIKNMSEGYNITATYADPAALQERTEFHKLGIPTTTAQKDVMLSIELVRRKFANKQILIDPSCKKLISEIKNYRWKPQTPSQLKDQPVKLGDDLVDSLRMFVQSTYTGDLTPWKTAAKFESIPGRRKI